MCAFSKYYIHYGVLVTQLILQEDETFFLMYSTYRAVSNSAVYERLDNIISIVIEFNERVSRLDNKMHYCLTVRL